MALVWYERSQNKEGALGTGSIEGGLCERKSRGRRSRLSAWCRIGGHAELTGLWPAGFTYRRRKSETAGTRELIHFSLWQDGNHVILTNAA
eukprot:6204452-Pleurochrysis_carterae.AAC.2